MIPSAFVKKGQLARAVIVRTRKELRRIDGSYIRFDTNSAVLISKDNEPVGSRDWSELREMLRDDDPLVTDDVQRVLLQADLLFAEGFPA